MVSPASLVSLYFIVLHPTCADFMAAIYPIETLKVCDRKIYG